MYSPLVFTMVCTHECIILSSGTDTVGPFEAVVPRNCLTSLLSPSSSWLFL